MSTELAANAGMQNQWVALAGLRGGVLGGAGGCWREVVISQGRLTNFPPALRTTLAVAPSRREWEDEWTGRMEQTSSP